MYIYKITNTINGKVYIGQTNNSKKRFGHHKSDLKHKRHRNAHLQSAWNKYGISAFTFDVIEKFDSEMNFNLDNLERYWIKYYDSTNPTKGYNRESGGNRYKKASVETRKKISEAKLGKKHTEITKIRMSLSRQNITLETKAKLSAAKKGPKNHNFGKDMHRGNGPHSKKVIDTLTGTIFNCAKDAADSLNIKDTTLRAMLKGQNRNKTSLKYFTEELPIEL